MKSWNCESKKKKERSDNKVIKGLPTRGIKYILLLALLAAGALLLYGCGKNDQLEPCTVKTYDEAGHLTQTCKKDAYDFNTEIIDTDGKLISKYEMKRESDGRLTERKSYDPEGNLLNTEKYEYDGNTATVTSYDPSGEKTENTSEWEFDSGNRPVKVTTFDEEGEVISKGEYERDSYGNIKKMTLSNGSSGELKVYLEQIFDITYKDGHAIRSEDEYTFYDDDGKVSAKQKLKREFEY